MKKKINFLFGLVIVLFLILGYLGYKLMPQAKDIFIILSGLGLVATLNILNRITIFRKKLDLALRHILANNFQTGMSLAGKDELALLAKNFNQVIDRINEYDVLRENRVMVLNRIIGIINRNIQSAVMIFDLDSQNLKINHTAQEIFGMSQDELSIDSVIRLESNSAFNKLYQEILNGRANTITGDIELFLPILKAKAKVNMKMFAVKDQDEKLKNIVCLFTKA